jgi:hypothetical protein
MLNMLKKQNADVQDGRRECVTPLVLQPKGVQMLQGHLPIKVHPPAIALAS